MLNASNVRVNEIALLNTNFSVSRFSTFVEFDTLSAHLCIKNKMCNAFYNHTRYILVLLTPLSEMHDIRLLQN